MREELVCTSMLMPSRSLTGVHPPSGSVADIWETLLLRGGIVSSELGENGQAKGDAKGKRVVNEWL